MNAVFSGGTLGVMISVAVVCTLLPLAYLGYFKAKNGAKISTFLIGMGFSILFSFIGESLLNYIFLILLSFKNFIDRSIHPVYTVIYSSIIAGVTAEIGSYIAFRFCMKKRPGKVHAFTFALGKGGFECIIYGGISYISNIMMALVVNNYGLDGYISRANLPADRIEETRASITALAATPSDTYLLNGTQLILSLCLSTALAIFVYLAVAHKEKFGMLLPVAIVLHCIGYLPTYLNQAGILNNMTVLISISLVYTFAILVVAYRLYHGVKDKL